jgi:mono/diheme cytochrome c family protein
MMKRLLFLCLGAAFLSSILTVQSAENEKKGPPVDVSKLPPASDKKDVTYAADIKPIFDKSCARCHGAERPKARLRLDSLEGALKGSKDGKVILPGNSAGSILVHSAGHVGDPEAFMPPPNNKAKIAPLTDEQVGLIRAWIDQGAK